jgi:hypothetical protein
MPYEIFKGRVLSQERLEALRREIESFLHQLCMPLA